MSGSGSIEKNYDDIINTKWPLPLGNGHARMGVNQRAKIFLPFAALKGYEESLANQREISQEEAENPRTFGVEWSEYE